MPITIRPLTAPLPLDEYAEGMQISVDGAPRPIHVWLNPPRAVLEEHAALRTRSLAAYQALQAAGDDPDALKAAGAELAAIGDSLAEFYSRQWSQHPDKATHWSADEVRALGASDTDPALYGWLTAKSIALVNAHRERARKN